MSLTKHVPRRFETLLALVSMATLLLLESACGRADNPAQAKHGAPRFPVTAVVAQPKSVPIFQEFIGATFALNTVQVNSRVNGYIEKWLFRPGDFVSEGQHAVPQPRRQRSRVWPTSTGVLA